MTGFRGRAGLFELLTVSDAARSPIQPMCDEGKLRQQALQDGLQAAAAGRRDEGRRRRDHARRGAARDPGLGVSRARTGAPLGVNQTWPGKGRCLESAASAQGSEGPIENQERARLLVGPDVRRRRRHLRDRRDQLQHGARRARRNDPCAANLWARMSQLSAHPGAGYFPLGLAILLAILGAIVLFKSLTIETEGGDQVGAFAWRPLLIIVAAIARLRPDARAARPRSHGAGADRHHQPGRRRVPLERRADQRDRADDRLVADLRLWAEADHPGLARFLG